MEEKKYLYSVRPRRTIKGLPEVGPIRTAKSLYLSKEEVLICMKDATVYRRFAADNNVQVTGRDLDRLHNDTFYSEKEWEKLKADSLGKDRGTTEEVKSVEDSKEAKADEKSVATVVEQEPTASAPGQEASENGTDAQEVTTNTDETVGYRTQTSESTEPTETDSAVTVSQNSDETERKNDATFAQSSDEDQSTDVSSDAEDHQEDEPQANFQPSHIQMNISGKKKNKR